MKLIMLDHFRRWWWVWVIVLVGSVLLGLAAGQNRFCMIFPIGMFLGAMLLSFDLQRGHARSLVTMPVTARQLARAWWWLMVGLPMASITLLTFLVRMVYGFWCNDWSSLPAGGVFCLLNFLTLAGMFYALTGLPKAGVNRTSWPAILQSCFFGGLWGVSFAGWLLFQNMKLTFGTEFGLFLAAAALAILGWFRAETLVRERAGSQAEVPALRQKNRAPERSVGGYGGCAFLVRSIFLRMVFMGVAMFAIFAVVLPWINHISMNSNDSSAVMESFPIFSFQFLWIVSIQIIGFAMHVRYLRTLPIPAAKLAAVLVFTTLAAMLVVFFGSTFILAAIFHSPLPTWESLVRQGGLLQATMASAVVPLFIWRAMEPLTFFFMVLVMGGGMVAVFFKQNISGNIGLVLSAVILFAVFMITKMLLERNSRAYRPRSGQFMAWNIGGGR